ncbi:MAG: hypothetical protein Q4B12_04995 [Bowdeniella nasicola]|nr:hypothetical protein [Bowdeniella nasicola]
MGPPGPAGPIAEKPATQVPITGGQIVGYGSTSVTVRRSGNVVTLDGAYSFDSSYKTGATLCTLPEWARPREVLYRRTYDQYRLIVLTTGEVKIYDGTPGQTGKRVSEIWLGA